MADGGLAVQTAIFAALDAALSVSVYDHVPQDEAAPFVSIGQDVATIEETKTRYGVEHTVEVNIYSSQRGLSQVKTIMGQVYDALHRVQLTVTGFDSSPPVYDFSASFIEPDGSRGVIRFTVRTQTE